MNEERFFQLLNAFKASYSSYYGDELKSQLVGDQSVYCIKNEEDLLLFTLFSLKSGLTYDVSVILKKELDILVNPSLEKSMILPRIIILFMRIFSSNIKFYY